MKPAEAGPQEPVEGEVRGEGRPFTQFLMEQRKGLLHQELTDQLAELVQAVREEGKAGTLTLTLKVAPVPKADSHVVFVADDLKVKAPSPEKGPSMFFSDENGSLTRNDPRQRELPLREVPGGDR